ncbi:MAG TPA: UDP-N-acetylmuramate dehydrogenase [Vicingus sp.]|nr:UDP-N-acetylmuramate dehydrogenase [Flavobacteriales bacterium]MCL4856731.1 UDP-N-acetylmuramate dehydrogenase [Flavobacteriales bacterium]HRN40967.1 UDP-N-acetylmuramate dehydrogenase [Vicingus sp.]HRP58746.1 UDP-N-acetylmuramate dehydrogenase [Vicingus sp.]
MLVLFEIKHHISLKPFNTFSIDVTTNSFVEVNTVQELKEVLSQNKEEILIIGGGSNILFTQDFSGLVIKNSIKGIDVIFENENEIILNVGAGENWHDFVMFCVENNYAGIENLSLIPGTVGASPMQNIGAYGVEVKDVILNVEALKISDLSIHQFSNSACEFDYRSSIFKTTEKGKYFITAVQFKLSKKPAINSSYGAIEDELKSLGVFKPSIKDISKAVINIRKSKLPDPKEIGNSGSFFKNPVVDLNKKNELLAKYPSMPYYPQKNGTFKLAAGWLIETLGWKGKRIENYGVHEKQALVLVNYGGASGSQIYNLSEEIISTIRKSFGIELEREVNIL